MRRTLKPHALLFGALLLAGCASARIVRTQPEQSSPGEERISITPPLKKLPVGETLEYEISWWGVPVGTAVFQTTLPPKGGGRMLFLRFEAESNWYLRTFYPARARLASWIDPQTVSPRRFESYLKRQWRLHESVITFNHSTRSSIHRLTGDKTVVVPFGPNTQDGLSLLYYVRTIPFELGKTIPLEIAADGKNWPLKGEIVRASVIRIEALGEVPAVEGRLELAYPVPFFHGSKARIWFSADANRIPLLAKINSRIGPVTVVLTRYKPSEASDQKK